jgi:hypothetical protein
LRFACRHKILPGKEKKEKKKKKKKKKKKRELQGAYHFQIRGPNRTAKRRKKIN